MSEKNELYFSQQSVINSQDITYRCSKCQYIPLINIIKDGDEYKIKTKCRNNHNEILSIQSFLEKNQNYDLNNIKCSKCNYFRDEFTKFYYCLNCKNFLCNVCKEEHSHSEEIISINQLDSFCTVHNDTIAGFCEEIGNMCLQCKEQFKNKYKMIYLSLISEEKENIINKKLNEDKNFIKNIENEIKNFERKIEKYKKILNDLNYVIEIEKNLFQTYKKECNNNLCYEIIQNIENCLNFKIKFEIKIVDSYNAIKTPYPQEIHTLNPLNLCKCGNILSYHDKKCSIITLNLPKEEKNIEYKSNIFYIPLYDIPNPYKISIPKIHKIKEIKKLLLFSNQINITSSDLNFFLIKKNEFKRILLENEIFQQHVFVYPSNKTLRESKFYPLNVIFEKPSIYPRFLLLKNKLSFQNFLIQIFFYIRKYIIIPSSQKEFEKLQNELRNMNSFLNKFSFLKREFLKYLKNNNIPFSLYIENNLKDDRFFLWNSNKLGNGMLKIKELSDPIDDIIKSLDNNYKIYVKFYKNSEYYNYQIELDNCEKIHIQQNIIYKSLDFNSSKKIVLCPQCHLNCQFKFNKILSDYYIFVFDTENISFENFTLYLENNEEEFVLYEKEDYNNIKSQLVLFGNELKKVEEFIDKNRNKILFFKKKDKKDINFLDLIEN